MSPACAGDFSRCRHGPWPILSDQTQQKQEGYGANRRDSQAPKPAAPGGQTQYIEQNTAQHGTEHPDNNVSDGAKRAAFDQLPRQPTGRPPCNRVRSGFTQAVKSVGGTTVGIHKAFLRHRSGQLPFLGLMDLRSSNPMTRMRKRLNDSNKRSISTKKKKDR
jgi:hypothetical protein